MIYWLLFYEFFTIGLVAIGGGLVTIPFLADLGNRYGWFSLDELADMIAIAEVTPGTIGINMATFAGYNAIGVAGGIIASFALSLPAFLILLFFGRYVIEYKSQTYFQSILAGIRPVAIALILYAGWIIGYLSLTEYKTQILAILLTIISFLYKKSPIIYIAVGAVAGIIFEM